MQSLLIIMGQCERNAQILISAKDNVFSLDIYTGVAGYHTFAQVCRTFHMKKDRDN